MGLATLGLQVGHARSLEPLLVIGVPIAGGLIQKQTTSNYPTPI